MRKQSSSGRFTKEMSILITKELQDIADEALIRIKPVLRDELERTHRKNIYASYTPAVNGTYHHTGTLASHIKGLIDGNAVKTVIEDVDFPNSFRTPNAATSTTEVYEILKNGSKANSRATVYVYEGKDGTQKYSNYIQQEPHNFEQNTLEDMENYINQDLIPALTSKQGYLYKQLIQKYKNKRI